MITDILLVTLNSTYQHTSFGLRYLMANLGELQARAQIKEFTIARNPRDIAESLLAHKPKIIGISVYIWNATETFELVSLLKRISPETTLILGGPEVSHESESNPICKLADYVIKGEGDFLFRELCESLLITNDPPQKRFISGPLPDIKQILSPYHLYSEDDIKNRVIYVEVSRGCPYKCEYCLSSLDKGVRNFDVDVFLEDMQKLMDRGLRQFKFIDRTFNLSPTTCTKILEFFLERVHLNLFLHFEMVPDRLPQEIRDLIKKFPHGALQFEIGIQTWNADVAKLVSRRNDLVKVQENFKFLANETGVHTHADLIVGLPGETIESFAKGFDILAELQPDEIQVGILKRLKGAPISRHDFEWQMVYSDHPPFEILRNKNVNFEELQKMNRFAKYWDLYANSGIFKNFVSYLKQRSLSAQNSVQQVSFFWEFFEFSEFMSARHINSYGISQLTLFESALVYLTENIELPRGQAVEILAADYLLTGKKEVPRLLRLEENEASTKSNQAKDPLSKSGNLPKRQQQHIKV